MTLSDSNYEAIKDRSRRRSREASRAGRDIRLPPLPKDLARRAAALSSLRAFLETYYPNAFEKPWAPFHLKAIATIERCIRQGGLFAMALPRGSGKTTIIERAAIWAVVTGLRKFVVIVGATDRQASLILSHIKSELLNNALLHEDFPAELWGIIHLAGDARRCIGQHVCGVPTQSEWSKAKVVLATIPGSACAGSILTVAGLMGALRGMSHTTPAGNVLRPDLVLPDDPQTRESANSPSQSDDRSSIISGDVLAMGGPGKSIAALMQVTIIRKGDLADRFTDRMKRPEWQGFRESLLLNPPANQALVEEYAERRADSFRMHGDGRDGNAFYAANQEAIERGAKVSWPERFNNPDEISGIQHAINLQLLDPLAFAAEYQNEPADESASEVPTLTADEIAAKINGLPRLTIPARCDLVTAHIDVHDGVLFYALVAFRRDFTASVIDFGTFPDQQRASFTLRKAPRTLQREFPGVGINAAILKGLSALMELLSAREMLREDGAQMRLARGLVDAGYVTDTVHSAIRASKHAAIWAPSRGKGISAAQTPINEYIRHPGDFPGDRWRLTAQKGGGLRYCLFDANFWKSFVQKQLAVGLGDAGSLSLFGSKPHTHALFAQHLAAETPKRVTSQGRVVDEWHLKPGRDNHWLDNVVGAYVAASMCGCSLNNSSTVRVARPQRRRRRVGHLNI
jgi:Phage terminase large subunit (GpA)